jgi:hypothetical protein
MLAAIVKGVQEMANAYHHSLSDLRYLSFLSKALQVC